MSNVAKVAIAVAAVLVVAFIGFSLLNGSGGVAGGPAVAPSSSASPLPSPQPSASPQPSPSPSPVAVFPPADSLEIGQHAMTLEAVPFTFTLPTSGWISNGSFGIDKSTGVGPDGAGFIFWTDTPVGVYTDPCAQAEGPPVGASAADLAAAVATVPGTDLVTGPTDVTVGGYPAKSVVVTVREDVDCDAMSFYLWYAPTEGLARYATELGSTIMVWIIDVGGTLVWIDGETYKGASPEPRQEIQRIIDSIQFE
jgi:hypothetical protein